MEYLEDYGDMELDTVEYDAEAINKQLDMLDRDRMARENGEKPANEWTRKDFKDLLHAYPKTRHLRTCELCALFLVFEEQIGSVDYYKRGTMEQMRQCRAHGGPLFLSLAIPDYYSFERWNMKVEKLWKIWRNLGKTRENE